MFTGIIEEIGRVQKIVCGKSSAVVTVATRTVTDGLGIGDSVAVNGACLTVTDISRGAFSADIMHETLHRTGLGALKAGSPVNLERAMPSTGRFGGHIVTGHIDGEGVVTSMLKDGNATLIAVRAPDTVLRYIVEKGSVALDGVSLTVARVCQGAFAVSVIPHTLEFTTLGAMRVGDKVNIECDILGKYAEKFTGASSAITRSFLTENGF